MRLDNDKDAEPHVQERDELFRVFCRYHQNVFLLHDEPGGQAPDANANVKDHHVDCDFGAARLREQRNVCPNVVAAVDECNRADLDNDLDARRVRHLKMLPVFFLIVVAARGQEQVEQRPEAQQHGHEAEKANGLGGQREGDAETNHADNSDGGKACVLAEGDVERRHAPVGGRLGEEGDKDEDVINVGGGKGAARRADGLAEMHGRREAGRANSTESAKWKEVTLEVEVWIGSA